MGVLQEIYEWSKDRPDWQKDALRRLVGTGELNENDVQELTEICKAGHGLAEKRPIVALSKEHIPEAAAGASPVTLVSIFHRRGVNALAEGQTLQFGPRLTVVYGDNGAGKTGYIRILKNACRARGQEQILGNVIAPMAPLSPLVSIEYTVGEESESRNWTGDRNDESITRVSVFDTQCAAVYLTEKTDVAFRPYGLDLFDKLVKACKAVRAKLENEKSALSFSSLSMLQTRVPTGTEVSRFLGSISSLTSLAALESLSRLTEEEEGKLALLESSLLDLQANDPGKLIRQLVLLSDRVRTLARHLKETEINLSVEAIKTIFEVRAKGRRKSEEARRLRDAALSPPLLLGTGSDLWKDLWEAARRFSQDQAYRGQVFPVVDPGSQCVLCQQDLDHAAAHRLRQFEAFVVSMVERELGQIRKDFAQLRKIVVECRLITESVEETLKEIRVEHETLAQIFEGALASNEARRKMVVSALLEDKDLDTHCPALVSVSEEANKLTNQIDERIRALRLGTTEGVQRRIYAEAQELRARRILGTQEQAVREEIERQKKFAAYGLCIEETRTQAITQKSSAVTKLAVSHRLKEGFKNELDKLDFRDVEVELKEFGGSDGVFYHKLVLTRTPGIDLPKVVSEGEQRCLSIAAFFAELSTADDMSAIVFDDPVSSLDYQWRQQVALRLVQEALVRQVIVFTHDIVFLLLLKQFAREQDIDQRDQHVRSLAAGAGVCVAELPWVALPIRKKIGYLKKCWQEADKLFREGLQDAYEKEAKYIYGLLREAWERALEEVLLNGVVERYRPSVQTQQVGRLADVTAEDCSALEKAMTKCSKWLVGHDQAAAARAPVPEPTELDVDIKSLDTWVQAIRKRRE